MSLARLGVAPEKTVIRPVLPMSFLPGIAEMQMAKSYFEKLKDPRWQKKRLEVLEAGGWKCASCNDAESTLHVHHRQYFKGREPWEYEAGQLEVLCEQCHTSHHEDPSDDPLLVAASFVTSTGPTSRDAVASLIHGFCSHQIEMQYSGDPGLYVAGGIARMLEDLCIFVTIDELAEALKQRDKWTVRAAVRDFILDLKTRPDAPAEIRRGPSL